MSEEQAAYNVKPIVIDMGRVEDWTLTDLRYACSKNKVKGYSKMSKEELVAAVKDITRNMIAKREGQMKP